MQFQDQYYREQKGVNQLDSATAKITISINTSERRTQNEERREKKEERGKRKEERRKKKEGRRHNKE